MLTPAIKASSTSEPPVIISNALATQVCPFSFFDLLPFDAAMTTGLTLFGDHGRRLCRTAAVWRRRRRRRPWWSERIRGDSVSVISFIPCRSPAASPALPAPLAPWIRVARPGYNASVCSVCGPFSVQTA